MPTAIRTERAKAKQAMLALELAKQEANPKKTTLTSSKAAILVDKNSRTIMKLSQLLAIYNKPGACEKDHAARVAHHIERYKQRIARRLGKLAKVCLY